MKTDQELVAAADLSFVGSFRTLAQHCPEGQIREIGAVFAFVTGLPIPLFNGCVIVAPVTASELGAAVEWVSGHGFPCRFWIDEERAGSAADIALACGLQRGAGLYPGMVLHPIPDPPPWPPGVTVVPVSGDGLAEHQAVRVRNGMAPEAAQRLYSSSFAADPDVRLFTARLDGEPVGGSIAIRTGTVSGVYAVGTIPTARRRGVGTAVSWAAVQAGQAWGCDTIVLQASAMGLPIYRAMGFQTVVAYTEFKRGT